MGWRILGGVVAAFAGFAARRALIMGWKKTTGNKPPANPESPGTKWIDAIAWAIASGVLMGLARMLAIRTAAKYYRLSTGHLPKGMQVRHDAGKGVRRPHHGGPHKST
jgi:Protein of unknown function (DUF4235)